jgi:hypothetical protein
MAHTKTDIRKYPGIQEVSELFGLSLLTDLIGEDGEPFSTVFYIGQQSELAAGLRGFDMTPCFNSLAKLEQFCQSHIARFRQEAETDSYPDATKWEQTDRMPEKFWHVYNFLADRWYAEEYGQVETADRWYFPAMLALEKLSYQTQTDICLCGAPSQNGVCSVPDCVCTANSEQTDTWTAIKDWDSGKPMVRP